MDDELFHVNGVNAATGSYVTDPAHASAIAEAALSESLSPDTVEALLAKWASELESFAPADRIDAKDLSSAGWGMIFAFPADDAARARQEAVRQALAPLIERRKAQAGALFKDYSGPLARLPKESALAFLARQGSGPGPVDPSAVPYYLLIVADPQTIPFQFQYLVDLDYAVGRLHFETVEEYARYAQGVVDAETNPPPPTRRVVLFGTRNDDDVATQQSADLLVGPLADKLSGDFAGTGWAFETVVGQGKATKANLATYLGGAARPDLLFTASHGVAFPLNDPRQLPHQGALLCQDWPGPAVWGNRPVPASYYFSADDLTDAARVGGLIAFHFACYGAGTPALDEFPHPKLAARPTIAPRSFLARLPNALLAHPGGGALAVVGHVERAWPCSFVWKQAGAQLEVFRDLMTRLLKHNPIGAALDVFNARYATLSAFVNNDVQDAKYGGTPDPVNLAYLWTAANDARGYVVLGDPAVRLPDG